nr:hypothetical protein VITISV_023429 [Ipomoea trifida]GMD97851.1 Retrovirus-related Pol polyprotein from transposon RE1 [Ipomoea batatas]
MEHICKSQQHEEAKASTEQYDDDQLSVATCFATSNNSSDSWLIDSGYTNHMTNDRELFKDLDKTTVSKVKIRNDDLFLINGKGTVAIQSLTDVKSDNGKENANEFSEYMQMVVRYMFDKFCEEAASPKATKANSPPGATGLGSLLRSCHVNHCMLQEEEEAGGGSSIVARQNSTVVMSYSITVSPAKERERGSPQM